MASAKEIRTKIKSVQSTKKITKAMEMVAASKMRRVQEAMLSGRDYLVGLRSLVADLSRAFSDTPHSYLVARPVVKNVGLIFVSSDKGLCGGLNTGVMRVYTQFATQCSERGVGLKVSCFGQKGLSFLNRIGAEITASAVSLGDIPQIEIVIGPVQSMVNAFETGVVDEVHVCFTRFINTMRQEANTFQLLPIVPGAFQDQPDCTPEHVWDYLYEPSLEEVSRVVMARYIETSVYQAVLEHSASEQSARMVAMKSASDNALDVIAGLQLQYNKSRQAAITKELSEIVGGASAV